ncbi:MAG TPA: hypothetical protein VM487_22545 [Phycisphaerae bacterium]|nr:hypothetical protein [Phycisphaerae bacterium]
MVSWMMAASIALAYIGAAQQVSDEQNGAATSQAATSQPASRPAGSRTTFRKPDQARVLEELLQRKEMPKPILPSYPQGEGPVPSVGEADRRPGEPLLLEGTVLVERPGRYVTADGRALFLFHADASSRKAERMEILANQYLEIMENEVRAGISEFVITAEVTSYRGQNYLLLRKVLRRVPNRNLSP